jgi:hypothetical protein
MEYREFLGQLITFPYETTIVDTWYNTFVKNQKNIQHKKWTSVWTIDFSWLCIGLSIVTNVSIVTH